MGDISEMMLDGTLCEACGVAMPGDPPGYPRYCSRRCQQDRRQENPVSTKVACPVCNRRVKRHGLANHMRDAHQGDSNA